MWILGTETNNGYNLSSNTLINYIHGEGCILNYNNKPGYYKLVSGYAQCINTYTCSLITPEVTGCIKSNAGRLVIVNNAIYLCIKVSNINGISLKNDYYLIIPFANSTDKYLVKKENTFLKFDNSKSEYFIVKCSENSITIDFNYSNYSSNVQTHDFRHVNDFKKGKISNSNNIKIKKWL